MEIEVDLVHGLFGVSYVLVLWGFFVYIIELGFEWMNVILIIWVGSGLDEEILYLSWWNEYLVEYFQGDGCVGVLIMLTNGGMIVLGSGVGGILMFLEVGHLPFH